MDQLTALKELLANVEEYEGAGWPITMSALIGKALDVAPQNVRGDFYKAVNGSMDSANVIREFMLGDRWEWVMTSDTVDVWKTSSSAMLCERSIRQGKSHDNPARAWTIANIKAKIAELED